jgi:hypothetical protein
MCILIRAERRLKQFLFEKLKIITIFTPNLKSAISMKTNILPLLFWLFTTFSITAAHVRIVFPFNPTNVVLHLWGSYTRDFNMASTGTNEYSVTIPDINQFMLFNVSYDLPEYNITNWWIGSGNEYRGDIKPNRFDAHGLKLGKIYINNQLINNAYTIENGYDTGLNIAVKINDDNTIEPHKISNRKHLFIDDRIPAEVHHRYPYLNTQLPQANHVRISGWLQALTDNNIIGDSKIEVDYIRVYGWNGNDSVLLVAHEYNSYDPNNDGGLYLRYPFFPEGFDQHSRMPGSAKDGILTFYPSDVRDSVWHWWSHWHDTPIAFNFDSYKMISRIRITGHAVVQGGIDFRDAAEKTYELGVTDWYYENGGEWQEVIFDSRSFKTTSGKTIIESGKSTDLQLVVQHDGYLLKYAGLIPGDYRFSLYDLQGQLLMNKQITIDDVAGKQLIKSDFVNQHQILVFELSNQRGMNLTGKQIQRN